MTLYHPKSPDAGIALVETQPSGEGSLLIIRLRSEPAKRQLQAKLEAAGKGMSCIENTGNTLVFSCPMKEDIAQANLMAASGAALTPIIPQKPFEPWVLRSIFGFVGQTLQLISSFLRPQTKGKTRLENIDRSTFLFASTNLTANGINLAYKEQNTDDPHQLAYLKTQTKEMLRSFATDPDQKFDPKFPTEARPESEEARTARQKANNIMERYSVNIGELGLRYVGALGLAGNSKIWNGIEKSGGAWFKWNTQNLKVYAGTSSIVGKTVALSSQIPDPFNPEPKTWLQNLREQWTFLIGGLIEVTSFSALAYENFMNTKPGTEGAKHGLDIFGKKSNDWLGGIGASLFVCGYITRSWAQFGKRNVNMEALYNHISDHLAALPPEKIPEALSAVATNLEAHFATHNPKAQITYGQIFKTLTDDLKTSHHIHLQPAALAPVVTKERTGPSQHVNDVENPQKLSGFTPLQSALSA